MAKLFELRPDHKYFKVTVNLPPRRQPEDAELKQKLRADLDRFEKVLDELISALRILKTDARRLGRRFK
jgi:hypothetical protein